MRLFWPFIFLFCSLNVASAQELTSEQSLELSRAIAADERFQQAFETCPASSFDSERGSFYKWGLFSAPSWSACRADPTLCLDACKSGSKRSCFYTARLLQRSKQVVDELDERRVFAFGCLAGSRSSCTNRGASLRNVWHKDDTFQNADPDKRIVCQTELFRKGCGRRVRGKHKGWGCFMLAQAHENGEGVPPDKQRALNIYSEIIASTCQSREDETSDEKRTHPACTAAKAAADRLKQ